MLWEERVTTFVGLVSRRGNAFCEVTAFFVNVAMPFAWSLIVSGVCLQVVFPVMFHSRSQSFVNFT